jgi:PAS domain S-box-containing protein
MTLSRATGEGPASRLIDAFPGFVGIYTLQGGWLADNGRSRGVFGGPSDPEEGTAIWDLPPWSGSPELQTRARGAVDRAARGERFTFDAAIVGRSGVVADHEFTFSPVLDKAGGVSLVAVFGVDVSARSRAVEALVASERRYRELVENAGDGILVADVDGRHVDVNARACQMLGYAREELLGLRIRDLLDPTEPYPNLREIRASVRVESVLRHKDGTSLPVEITAVKLPDGNLLAIVRDITERKRAETALRQREEELVALSDATIEALFVHQGGVILATNKAARELYRLPPDGAVGQPLLDYVAPEAMDLVRHHIAARSAEPYEAVARRADGTTFPAAVQARTVTFRGRPARLAAIRDLTELRKMQASLAFADRMASVGTLAAGVAHEINNPLTFITVGLEDALRRLQAAPPDAATLRAVSDILRDAQEGARRVGAIVRDLKSFSRADDEATGPTELGPVIDYVARMAEAEIKHRARLVVDLGDVPPVEGSDTRLSQVFLNLLVNAAQAIPPGAASENTISVSARAANDRVVVTVSDTGQGIAPQLLERIFDPFVSTKAQGTGLGLAICHGIVTRLGGAIDVESAPGRGTTFRVTLPVARASRAEAPLPPATARRMPARKPRLLIVDDEPILLKTTARVLEDDHEIALANTAKEALALLEQGQRFDVILCDLMMPEMTGMQLFERLRERWPDMASRVVFLTGGVFTRQAANFLAASTRPHLDKPFTVEAVRQAVGKLMAGA